MSAKSKTIYPKPISMPVYSESDNGHMTITLHDGYTMYQNPGGFSGSIPNDNKTVELARILCQYPNCTFEIKDRRKNVHAPDKMPRTETFRIFRRSENRNNFGHREYFLMNQKGEAFKGCRVYDLPLNGEIKATYTPFNRTWNWAALSFEVMEQLKDAPPKLVKEVFTPKAVSVELDKLVLA